MATPLTHKELEQMIKDLEEENASLKSLIQTLQETESNFVSLTENSSDLLLRYDKDFRHIYVGPNAERFLGITPEDIMNRTHRDLNYPEEICRFWENSIQKVFDNGQTMEEEFHYEGSGDERYFSWHTAPEVDSKGAIKSVIGILRDTTHRRQAEEALKQNEEKFRTLVEITSDLIWEINIDGAYTYVNPRVKDLLGYDVDKVIGTKLFEFMSESEAKRTKAFIQDKNKSPKPFSGWQVTLLHKNGRQLIVEINGAPIFDRNGHLYGWHGYLKDITQRKRAEEAIRESEERFRSLVELTSDWVWETDKDHVFTYADPKISNFLGYELREVIGKSFTDFMPKEEAKRATLFLKTNSLSLNPFSMFENTQIHRDGSHLVIETSGVPIFDPFGNLTGWRGINKDITERKKGLEEKARLQHQIQQAQKMEAIGTLAGGIAHEFNNAIVAVTGNIELLQMDLPDEDNLLRYIESMKASSHRMTRLTNQLLAYAGGGKYRTKTICLNDFVEETLAILQHNIDPAIRIETNLTGVGPDINADLTQMQMVFSAVLSNASEAIEGEGKIRITTNIEDVSQLHAKANPDLKPGPHVCLSIEDDGKGMEEDIRSKIFEPFFTTKFQGRGLGMAAVYGIIKNHGGSITVHSQPGKGTKASIYLPSIHVEPKKAEKAGVEVVTGNGTILVIEDEEIVLDVTRAMLEKLGYRILEAETGKQATEVVENFDGEIDLALLDIKLPDIDGSKLYPIIKKARPNLKVIVCSGYGLDGPAQEILDAGADDFLQKPFSFMALSEKLKEFLEVQ